MAAQAAFWQALSLPPLFLGLLGSLGYVGGWFGPETVDIVEGKIISFARRVFTPEVVDQLIAPTASSILTRGRADVASVGFLIALWAGSSAIASVVDSITEAHGQYGVRHPVWQRLFSLLIYLSALVVGGVHAAAGRAGPGPAAPPAARGVARAAAAASSSRSTTPASGCCWCWCSRPSTGPRCRTARRGGGCCRGRCWRWRCSSPRRPGCASTSTVLTATGYTYGALATPIAFLLFAFLLGLSIVLGAQLNNAVAGGLAASVRRRSPLRVVRDVCDDAARARSGRGCPALCDIRRSISLRRR